MCPIHLAINAPVPPTIMEGSPGKLNRTLDLGCPLLRVGPRVLIPLFDPGLILIIPMPQIEQIHAMKMHGLRLKWHLC